MLRKDYLLQQIAMLSGLVARLLKLRDDGDEQGAADEIEQSYRELFGFEPQLISLLPSEFLFDKIRSGEYLDTSQGIMLAILLREDAMNYGATGNALEHYQRLIRSLKVFLVVEHEHELTPEQLELYDVDTVLDQMTEYELPVDIKYDLFLYYEDIGQYGRAEDMLHEALQDSDSNPELVAEGISFYEWLLTLPDEDLDAGNLPRVEVEESLAQLKS
jgi:tetratricopeptide (TPR) repeat protein